MKWIGHTLNASYLARWQVSESEIIAQQVWIQGGPVGISPQPHVIEYFLISN